MGKIPQVNLTRVISVQAFVNPRVKMITGPRMPGRRAIRIEATVVLEEVIEVLEEVTLASAAETLISVKANVVASEVAEDKESRTTMKMISTINRVNDHSVKEASHPQQDVAGEAVEAMEDPRRNHIQGTILREKIIIEVAEAV
jgi:hypothetical protein